MSTSVDDIVLRLALEKGLLREDQIAAARVAAGASKETSGPDLDVLEELAAAGVLGAEAVAGLLAAEFRMARVDLTGLQVPAEVLALVPVEIARRYRLLPLARAEGTLRVAVADPLDTDGVDALAHRLNLAIEAVLAPAAEIAGAIERFYGEVASLAPAEAVSSEGRFKPSARDAANANSLASESDETSIIGLVQSILANGVGRRASDIHLEPLAKRFRLRYRVDGVLVEADGPPKRLQRAIVSRLKLMANISIAEKRVPQDGRLQLAVDGRALDLRVSSLPTAHGESIVMRVLDREGLKLGLGELGFYDDDRTTIERLLALPDGIVLVTGPTGSGKTTTLYSCLHHLNRPDRKIITVEDPVEYQLSGINQVPVRHEIGMTFASALRAMLRQAPNVVMVGEIRDRETAEIAIHASLTGHLVFSTLHTNDAPGAVARLIDLGVRPFLAATSLRAVLAQRLVRKICEKCRRACEPTAQELRAGNVPRQQVGRVDYARGAGCPACDGSGYSGRMGIFEMLVVNEALQQMIHDQASTARLREKARALGMRTMREDGLRKASAGLTTIEEVVSITVGDAR